MLDPPSDRGSRTQCRHAPVVLANPVDVINGDNLSLKELGDYIGLSLEVGLPWRAMVGRIDTSLDVL
jgi:hypothetical protein